MSTDADTIEQNPRGGPICRVVDVHRIDANFWARRTVYLECGHIVSASFRATHVQCEKCLDAGWRSEMSNSPHTVSGGMSQEAKKQA